MSVLFFFNTQKILFNKIKCCCFFFFDQSMTTTKNSRTIYFLVFDKEDFRKAEQCRFPKNKKLGIYIYYRDPQTKKTRTKMLYIGDDRYEDYTIHKDKKRKQNYISRHKAREDWTFKSGVLTKGFWSRWLLWNRTSLSASLKHLLNKNKNLKMVNKNDIDSKFKNKPSRIISCLKK